VSRNKRLCALSLSLPRTTPVFTGEVGVATETRGNNLRRISSPKSKRVRRAWNPTSSLIADDHAEPDTAEAIIAKGVAGLVSCRSGTSSPIQTCLSVSDLDCRSILMTAARFMDAKRAGIPIIRSIKNEPQRA
jgi:hypothetical protein